jgi:hypothetical protein
MFIDQGFNYLACQEAHALEQPWWSRAAVQRQIGGSSFHFKLPFRWPLSNILSILFILSSHSGSRSKGEF